MFSKDFAAFVINSHSNSTKVNSHVLYFIAKNDVCAEDTDVGSSSDFCKFLKYDTIIFYFILMLLKTF